MFVVVMIAVCGLCMCCWYAQVCMDVCLYGCMDGYMDGRMLVPLQVGEQSLRVRYSWYREWYGPSRIVWNIVSCLTKCDATCV